MSEEITRILIVAPSLIVGDNFVATIEPSPYKDLVVLPCSAGIHGLHKATRGVRFDLVLFLKDWDRGLATYVRDEFLAEIATRHAG